VYKKSGQSQSVFSLPPSVSTSSYNAANQQLVFGSYDDALHGNATVTVTRMGGSSNCLAKRYVSGCDTGEVGRIARTKGQAIAAVSDGVCSVEDSL
jgi:hypothetical protein